MTTGELSSSKSLNNGQKLGGGYEPQAAPNAVGSLIRKVDTPSPQPRSKSLGVRWRLNARMLGRAGFNTPQVRPYRSFIRVLMRIRVHCGPFDHFCPIRKICTQMDRWILRLILYICPVPLRTSAGRGLQALPILPESTRRHSV